MGPFDPMFDFNGNGRLDAFEQAAEFAFLNSLMEQEDERRRDPSDGYPPDDMWDGSARP